ncbi:MAG: hypothetical protein ACQERB_07415 [Promethearchaeati archaeon]
MKKLIPSLLFVVLCFSLVYSIAFVNASDGEEEFSFTTSLEMKENYDERGSEYNQNEININLLSSLSIIQDLQINFTDIKYPIRNITTIEDYTPDSNTKQINKVNHGYAVQINLNKTTTIYGVHIYIKNDNPTDPSPRPVYVMIKGFNPNGNKPNETTYGESILLNKSDSSDPGWYIQEFPSPIILSEGNYFLVLDGTAIEEWPQTRIDWYLNDVNPSHPDLYTSQLNSSGWFDGELSNPFLYKLIYKSEKIAFPEEINMTAEINTNNYKIINGTQKGDGILEKKNINLEENGEILTININNEISENLTFDFSYKLNVFADSALEANGIVRPNQNVLWTLNPFITRKSENMTIKFNYASTWTNLTVYKNGLNVSSDVIFNPEENYIFIPNDTIEDGADWEITANSPKFDIGLKTPKLEFKPGQELRFELNAPILEGNYTFILFDSFGLEVYRIVKTIPPDNNIFSYQIPENMDEGNFTAYVFWNSDTDAGVATQEFKVVVATGLVDSNFFLPIIIGVVIGGGSIIGFSSVVVIKKYNKSKKKELEDFLKECSELLNIKSIIVTEKSSGIALYSKSFGGKKLDGTLLSGFFQAIRNFGEEALEEFKNSRTVKLDYKEYVVLMNDFVNVRVIVVMKEQPSTNFQYTLDDLTYDIYINYGPKIDKFQGDLKEFVGIEKIIEKNINIDLLYPFRLNLKPKMKVKLDDDEKKIIQRAQNLMRDNNMDYFYSIYLLPENDCEPEDFETIKTLIEKDIFHPIKDRSKRDKINPLPAI